VKRSTLVIVIMLVVLALAGCQKEEIIIPTVAQLPTITATFTPTFTYTPTSTPTETYTPTTTPTSTETATFTPTMTFTPTPTPTLTFTPVFTSTFTPTTTPTFTPTVTGPQIYSFTADNYTMGAGGVTVLRWQGLAETAVLDQLNAQGGLAQSWSVPPSGEQAVTIPTGQGLVVTYRLTLIRQGIPVSQNLAITITCGYDWFFGNSYASNVCPVNVGAIGDGRFQGFDGGIMIYAAGVSGAFPGNKVYVLFYSGNQWQSYENVGSAVPTGAPPAGRYLPTDPILGNIWETGLFNGQPIKNILQFSAMANADGSARTIQAQADGAAVYIDIPDGRVFRLQGSVNGTWSQIK
jgi:hypothetical protein